MTSLSNEDVCRKSSVYNQTGQSYFQQLTAYNHMSAHLRRLVLAPCVVDSRNKKYARERDKHQQRHGSRCSCCYRARRRNLIEGLAYDTKHHPIDVLRMSLKCNSGCRSRHNNRESAPRERSARGGRIVGSKLDRGAVEYFQTPASQSSRSSGEPSRRNSSVRQYESPADSEFDSPIANEESVAGHDKSRDDERLEHSDEAKYAKFIYDITREIMINGFYTDEELQATFDKHLRINYDLLDRDKMLAEIDQLRTSLNPTADCSDDDDESNRRFADSGRFAAPSASSGGSTRTKALYRSKIADKIREAFEDSRRSSDGEKLRVSRNSPDFKSELYVAERDVVRALMEMKLDPEQIQTIRKRLRNKSRDAVALAKTVQVDEKRNYEHKSKERTNSSISTRPEWRISQLFRPSDSQLADNRRDEPNGGGGCRDRTSTPKHRHDCQCRCGHDTEIPDDLAAPEPISSANIERESQKEHDTRILKTSEKIRVTKIAKNIDAASSSAISVISSQNGILTKANNIDNSLADISEKSEERDNAAVENNATNGEPRADSAEVPTNIEPETANDELASTSEYSSQFDEAEIGEELMQISEEEETHDQDDVSVAVHM